MEAGGSSPKKHIVISSVFWITKETILVNYFKRSNTITIGYYAHLLDQQDEKFREFIPE